MRTTALFFSALCITGCASAPQPLGTGMAQPLGNCNVQVFSSLESAKSGGNIEELCLITGTSAPSLSHTVATAVQKHKDKACSCGADKVYIQAQDAGPRATFAPQQDHSRYPPPTVGVDVL